MHILCWFKHQWGEPVKAFAINEILVNWIVYRGYECKTCGKRKIKREGDVDSEYAANRAYEWRDHKEKKQSAQILKLVK